MEEKPEKDEILEKMSSEIREALKLLDELRDKVSKLEKRRSVEKGSQEEIRIDDPELVNLALEIHGIHTTILRLATTVGKLRAMFWETIEERYPETREGTWAFTPKTNEVILVKTSDT